MILKLILIGVVLIAIYRFMGGSFKLPKQTSKRQENDQGDALEECKACGTYVTRKESLMLKGKFYCCKECLPQ